MYTFKFATREREREHPSADLIKPLPSKLQVAACTTQAVEAGQQQHNLDNHWDQTVIEPSDNWALRWEN